MTSQASSKIADSKPPRLTRQLFASAELARVESHGKLMVAVFLFGKLCFFRGVRLAVIFNYAVDGHNVSLAESGEVNESV